MSEITVRRIDFQFDEEIVRGRIVTPAQTDIVDARTVATVYRHQQVHRVVLGAGIGRKRNAEGGQLRITF